MSKCECLICRAKEKLSDFKIRVVHFYKWLRCVKWITIEYQGSKFSDFRKYEVIGRKKVRMPDGKGFQWPKTHYNHVRSVDVGESND